MSKPLSEHQIQTQILHWLKLKGIFHWRNNSGGFGGAHKGKKWFVRFGAIGSPDIFALKSGRIYGIEVKGPKGVLSAHQVRFRHQFTLSGGWYVLAYSLDDVLIQLDRP